jgi:hypothetical protein
MLVSCARLVSFDGIGRFRSLPPSFFIFVSSPACLRIPLLQPPKQSQRADPNAMSAPAPSAPAPRARKGDFVDNRIGAGVVAASNPAPANNNENASANAGPRGFGDTGAPAIKVHHAPGGKSSGNILGWN